MWEGFVLPGPCYAAPPNKNCMVGVDRPVSGVERLSEAFSHYIKPLCLPDRYGRKRKLRCSLYGKDFSSPGPCHTASPKLHGRSE